MSAVLRVAGAYVGVPYVLRGRDPGGWDCWGCLRFGRKALFGKDSPCVSDAYDLAEAASPARLAAHMEGLVAQSISLWRPCAAQASAAVLLKVFGRPAHVGLLLDDMNFLHAQIGCETVISRLDEPMWAQRLLGCFDA